VAVIEADARNDLLADIDLGVKFVSRCNNGRRRAHTYRIILKPLGCRRGSCFTINTRAFLDSRQSTVDSQDSTRRAKSYYITDFCYELDDVKASYVITLILHVIHLSVICSFFSGLYLRFLSFKLHLSYFYTTTQKFSSFIFSCRAEFNMIKRFNTKIYISLFES
jgi:hypothetical protein